MPKNTHNSRVKSTRKPLREITNNGTRSSKPYSVTNKKKLSPEEKEEVVVNDDEGVLDRLLLAHSDLSNLIHQIDKLVVQAFKVKLKSRKEREEVESFTNVLSDMHSSLKEWVPRFQNVMVSPPIETENQPLEFPNQLAKSPPSQTSPTQQKEVSHVSDSPEQLDFESLVSPSPLVSWCTDRNAENGRQLFLLTPLPKSRAFSSKHQNPSKSGFERITRTDYPRKTTSGVPSLMTISVNTNDDLLEGLNIKPTPKKILNSVTEIESTVKSCGFVSPPKFSNGNHSVFLMTPRLKMSPPKSCVLLEPISEPSHQDFNNIRKSTPFPIRNQTFSPSEISEPSSSSISESLALKYPELFGIKQTEKTGNRRKQIETSMDLFMSPPKSCIVMEPPNDKFSINVPIEEDLSNTEPVLTKNPTSPTDMRKKELQSATKNWNQEFLGANTTLVESTPIWKEPESMIRTGKCLGENTLKRELWTRFEAASSNGICLDVSVFQETATKGFLDRLDEASCEL